MDNQRHCKGIAKTQIIQIIQKIFETCNPQNLATYKTYKNLFETIKRKSKKNYYTEKIPSFKGNAKKTWKTMKELTGKAKMNKKSELKNPTYLTGKK